MAEYEIVCTVQTGCTAGGHILAVGRGGDVLRVDDVYTSMDNGDRYFTDADGRKAYVRKWACTCGVGTLKSAADATLRNNLDSLPLCG
ncbi:DUF3892 domain-containing protein [Amycolatopsis sp. BJA-103]|uniref:DUF3892 domain-containing protein n=1 Tax=unclassified Amycolatopsis TaxID=2618356 RepID=UPI000C76EF5D|nr:DUF3892 domain-containing protein [Amycolatopsis sp. BJA-103]AUI62502.1 hypothetical protein BKN51_33005 [Amycolatopsis sp. BJA-103]PNE18339.1 hypothetical protein B1H26_10690 [Amycolatopsis sp. BJA-103]